MGGDGEGELKTKLTSATNRRDNESRFTSSRAGSKVNSNHTLK